MQKLKFDLSFFITIRMGSVRHEVFIPLRSVWDGYIIPQREISSLKNKVFDALWFIRKEAYADSTIVAVGKRLRHLERNTVLINPETVKGYIAQK